MKKLQLTALILFTVSLNAFANPWKECGIGAIIFDENRIAAAISNIIFDLGSTAITSDASSPDTCEGRKATAAHFINETYTTIEEQTINGSGDHVDAMLSILNCKESKTDEITASIRSSFSEKLLNSDYSSLPRVKKAEIYYNIVEDEVSNNYSEYCII